MDDEIRIRVSDIIFALRKHWKLIVVATVAGTLFGLMLTAMNYVQSSLVIYKINGSFAVSAKNEMGFFTGNGTSATSADFMLAEEMVPAIRYVLNSRKVIGMVIEDEKLIGVKPSDISANLSLSQYGETQIIDMSLIWRSPEEGVAIWNSIVNAGNRVIPKTLQLGTLVVINEAMATQMGISREGPNLAVLLSGLGLFAGMGIALISMLMHPTLNNLKDVDSVLGMETIGIIPQSLSWSEQNGNIMTRSKNSEAAESFSASTYILRNRLGTREKHHCFYVTSTTSKEGKSAVAANIAIQLAGMECRTLLIDFDTRNPDIGTMFLPEIDYAGTLNAIYRGDANEHDVITHVNGYLDLLLMLPEHNPIPLDGTIEELFTRLIERYEYVVINASPVGIVSEALSLNQVTNNAVFVVGYDSAVMSEIQTAIQKMDKAGARIIGCVVNGVKGKVKDSRGNKASSAKNHARRNRHAVREDSAGVNAELDEDLMDMTDKPREKQTGEQEEQTDAAPKQTRKKLWQRKGKAASDAARGSASAKPSDIMENLITEETGEQQPADSVHAAERLKTEENNNQEASEEK